MLCRISEKPYERIQFHDAGLAVRLRQRALWQRLLFGAAAAGNARRSRECAGISEELGPALEVAAAERLERVLRYELFANVPVLARHVVQKLADDDGRRNHRILADVTTGVAQVQAAGCV